MRVQLLGPVGLNVDGAMVGVGGPRAQAVLAVRAGEIVTADWLIDQLWGERPPRAARVSLQTYVSRLSEQGRAAAADRCWSDALQHVRNARDLWRGAPFMGIDGVPALRTEGQRLAELRVENHFTECHALLEVSGPSDVIGPLRELVDAHRWDERGWRLLMLALYQAGRQTEALEAVAMARRLLVEEHGLDPSPALAQLERKILVHDPTLDPLDLAPIRLHGWLDALATPLVGRNAELGSCVSSGQTSPVTVDPTSITPATLVGPGPTLLVTEDVHWAGVAALRLLDHVLASCANTPCWWSPRHARPAAACPRRLRVSSVSSSCGGSHTRFRWMACARPTCNRCWQATATT